MVPSSRTVRTARITCIGTFRRWTRSRTKLGRLVRNCLLRLLRCQRTRRDGRRRVDGFPKIEVGRRRRCGGGRGLGRFREVGGRTRAWVERLQAFGRVECDAEVAGERWTERCRAGFRVDLRRSGALAGIRSDRGRNDGGIWVGERDSTVASH